MNLIRQIFLVFFAIVIALAFTSVAMVGIAIAATGCVAIALFFVACAITRFIKARLSSHRVGHPDFVG